MHALSLRILLRSQVLPTAEMMKEDVSIQSSTLCSVSKTC
jgi:hypothetical protein